MISAAEVSLYPLGENDIGPHIDRFILAMERRGIEAETGPMSTIVRGDTALLFDALREAYEGAALELGVVMVVKISNACPM